MKYRKSLSLIFVLLMVSMWMPGFSHAYSEESDINIVDMTSTEDEHDTPDQINEADNDELLLQYIDKNVDAETNQGTSKRKKATATTRRSKLSEYDRAIYDAIQAEVDKIAVGGRSDSILQIPMKNMLQEYLTPVNSDGLKWKITSDSLGVDAVYVYKKLDNGQEGYVLSDEAKAKILDVPSIVSALSSDMSQSLYWFDKTMGYSYGLGALVGNNGKAVYFRDDPQLSISFTVSADYSRSGRTGTFELDAGKTAAATACIETVSGIINENSNKSDYDKLLAYMNKICSLTSYNSDAARGAIDYGDPWQMIYVFDGDSSTNVVCEGYSKAFQYLCDKSSFSDKTIECHTVSGTTSGPHMWNIVRMDDSRYYLVDITNSDAGSTGNPNYLFLTGCMAGDMYSGYSYSLGPRQIKYIYDQSTLKLFSEEELSNPSIGYLDYKKIDSWDEPGYEWASDFSMVTATRIGTSSANTGKQYLDRETRQTIKEVMEAAKCTKDGTGEYVARFYNDGFEEQRKAFTIPKKGHSWNRGAVTKTASEGKAGVKTFTCARCGQKYTEAIPAIVYKSDLPVVKISKPKAAKKKITVKWKKVSKKNQKKIQSVEIQVATDPGFTNIVKTATAGKKKTSKAIKGLKPKTKYYVRIRAYRNASDGKHVSKWKSKTVKVK